MNVLIFALGVVLGGFVVYVFNPKDVTVNGKAKAKKGGVVDFNNILTKDKEKKDGIFKRTIFRRKHSKRNR